jgi:vacuolar-type H+-ATPase catalytic subunit A/Vma1
MKNRNRIEDELNAVRIDLYEKTKGMTPDEEVAYLKSLSAPLLKEFGISTVNEMEADTMKSAYS